MHLLLFMPSCPLSFISLVITHNQTMPTTIFTKITLSSLDFQQLRLRFINLKAEVIIVQTFKSPHFSDACIFLFSERKRGRQTYTRYQTLELEKEFHFNRKVTGPAFTNLFPAFFSFRQYSIWLSASIFCQLSLHYQSFNRDFERINLCYASTLRQKSYFTEIVDYHVCTLSNLFTD